MPSVGLRAGRLETGNTDRRNRSSANRIYSVVSGCGTSRVDGEMVCWERGDTFSVTSGHWVEHQADEDAMLIEMSDEPLIRFSIHLRFELERLPLWKINERIPCVIAFSIETARVVVRKITYA